MQVRDVTISQEAQENGELFLGPVSCEDREHCLDFLREELGAEGLDESTCRVWSSCGFDKRRLLHLIAKVFELKAPTGGLWKLREILGVAEMTLPRLLVNQYRAPPHIAGLKDVLVSHRGIHCYVDGRGCPSALMGICKKCMRCINHRKMPKFAVAKWIFHVVLAEAFYRAYTP
ncbi:unnamed protein product [Phytophthora fragariaefolia]|uniref:Unnamed protein product n=1 Tax=Phytophthora fragariaefolia TaxID=1490495 RepID=A0A9W7DAB1_9STRA|nr:unnamed protein product [Phytophthora fragariaefolia]